MCEKIQHAIESCLQRTFQKWGRLIGRKGWLVVVITLVVFIPLVAGWAIAEQFSDGNIAWSPRDSQTSKNQDTIDSLPFTKSSIAIFIYAANSGENVLTKAHFQRILDFHQHLLTYQSNQLQDTECLQAGNRCLYTVHPVQYFEDANGNVDYSSITNDADLVTKINSATNQALSLEISVGDMLGGTTPENPTKTGNTWNYQEARAVKMSYLLRENEQLSGYVDNAISAFLQTAGNQSVKIQIWTASKFEDALSSGINSDLVIINISISLIVIYSLIVLGTCSPVGCRSAAAFIGVLCSLLAYGCSFGLCSIFGLNNTGIHNLLPFLLLGIGVDDMYVITAVADQVNPHMTKWRRMGKTLKLAGVSILITSLTDCVAFLVSSATNLPALSSFCVFAGIGILFDFIFEITLFSAFLAYDLDRQSRGRGDCCGGCCCKETVWICCCGKLRPKDQFNDSNIASSRIEESEGLQGVEIEANKKEEVTSANQGVVVTSENGKKADEKKKYFVDENLQDDKLYSRGSFIQNCLEKHYSRCIIHPITQIIVILFFVGLTAFAAWGTTNIESNFNIEFFVNDDHPLQQYYSLRDTYFGGAGQQGKFYSDTTADMLSETNQNKVYDVLTNLESNRWVVTGSVSSWYLNFLNFIDNDECTACSPASACKNNNAVLSTYVGTCLKQYFDGKGASLVGSKVVLTYNSGDTQVTAIQASESSFTIVSPATALEGVDTMNELRDVAKTYGPSGTFVFANIFFDYEQYTNFARDVAIQLVTAIIAIFVIVLIFSGNICTTLLVTLNIGLVDLNLLALIWYWGLELNFVTVVNLILAIGLAVDYSAHIAHAYNISVADPECQTNRDRRKSKVRRTFANIGNSVFHGAFSTFLAIVTISASSNYIFRAFFKQWFAIIIFGMLHGFVLLPVFLSFFGPLKRADKGLPLDVKSKE